MVAGALAELGRTEEAAETALQLIAAERGDERILDGTAGGFLNPLMESDDYVNTLRVLEALVERRPDDHDIKRFLCMRLVNTIPGARGSRASRADRPRGPGGRDQHDLG